MFQGGLLTDQDMEHLGEAVLTVLARVGALYQNREILRALETAGARVDHASEVAVFPEEMTREFLEGLRAEATREEPREFRAPKPAYMFHQLAQYVYDYERRERRLGNREDYIHLTKFCDVLHPEDGAGHSLLLSDVPAPVEPLEATLLQFEYAHRPRGAYVQDVRQIDYLMEIEEISGVEDLHWLANVSFSSPLRLGKDVADRFAYKVKGGDPANLYVMTACGAGAPVTVAGCTVIVAAEFMANWMAARALNPDAPLSAATWIATVDMGSGEVSYSAVDAMTRNLGVWEFMRRWTGVEIEVGGGEYCPAKTPGLYASLEKAYSAMTVAAFTGHHPGVGEGHLDGGLTISPVQLLLDREMATALAHLEGPIEVSKETIGLEAMLKVGHASSMNYMETEHTLQHFRSALWLPELLARSGWNGPQSEEEALDRAQTRVNELIASYEKPEVDEEKLAKMKAVVERARKECL